MGDVIKRSEKKPSQDSLSQEKDRKGPGSNRRRPSRSDPEKGRDEDSKKPPLRGESRPASREKEKDAQPTGSKPPSGLSSREKTEEAKHRSKPTREVAAEGRESRTSQTGNEERGRREDNDKPITRESGRASKVPSREKRTSASKDEDGSRVEDGRDSRRGSEAQKDGVNINNSNSGGSQDAPRSTSAANDRKLSNAEKSSPNREKAEDVK